MFGRSRLSRKPFSRAFNWTPPLYGHLPLLLNPDGTKLSKRQNDIKISHYRESGIFPLALMNFIVNSGGGFQKDLERGVKPRCFTLEELARQFSVQGINSHSGKLMPERLKEFNRLELERQLKTKHETRKLVSIVQNVVKEAFPDRCVCKIPLAIAEFFSFSCLELHDEYVETILRWSSNRIDRLSDLVKPELAFVWVIPSSAVAVDEEYTKVLMNFERALETAGSLEKVKLQEFLKEFAKKNGVKYATFMKTLRGLLSGLKVSSFASVCS